MSVSLPIGWLQHAPVLSVLLPLFTAVTLLLMGDRRVGVSESTATRNDAPMRWQRRISLGSSVLGLVMAVALVLQAATGELRVYRLGDWPAPFGIVMVVDRLSALMVLLSYLVAVPALGYAAAGWDRRGRFFHALFQFQLMGLVGAFLTGDLFNLFVFFEVLLIASYVLLLHGHGRERLRMGLHYVVLNLVASGLFLIGLSLVYAATGTLNMADVGQRVGQLQGDTRRFAEAASAVLLVVFGLKAAMLPLYFWLPGTYAAASAPVAALFAIMTKVGVYSIVRVHWQVFGAGLGAAAPSVVDWLLPLALATSALGVLGALAAHSLGRLVAYLTVASVGTILAGVGLFTPGALSAALYYTLHSTLVIAGLFLLVELIAAQRGEVGDRLQPAFAVREPVLLGGMLLFGAASAAGLPPLPGFLGKLMVLQASSGLATQVGPAQFPVPALLVAADDGRKTGCVGGCGMAEHLPGIVHLRAFEPAGAGHAVFGQHGAPGRGRLQVEELPDGFPVRADIGHRPVPQGLVVGELQATLGAQPLLVAADLGQEGCCHGRSA